MNVCCFLRLYIIPEQLGGVHTKGRQNASVTIFSPGPNPAAGKARNFEHQVDLNWADMLQVLL